MNDKTQEKNSINEEIFKLIFVSPDPRRVAELLAEGSQLHNTKIVDAFNHHSFESLICKLLLECRIDFSNEKVRKKMQEMVDLTSEAGSIEDEYIYAASRQIAERFSSPKNNA